MNEVTDLDLTGEISVKSGAPLGDAHELLVRAIMMRLGFEVGKVDLSSGPYDLMIGCYTAPGKTKTILKVQIKTISNNSLTLTGGSRAGVDREYVSEAKTYKYTEAHCDLIFGVDKLNFDIYVFPTMFASKYGKSVSKNKIRICKNNWNILLNWNKRYLNKLYKSLV